MQRINQLSLHKEGWKWLKQRKGPTWLTPHLVEFSRLFPELRGIPPLDAAKVASEITGSGILLKGANTVIAEPNGGIWQLLDNAPWVARAGWGDLLAGFSAGVGALGLASSAGFDHNLLAVAALIHSRSAFKCQEGSSASTVGEYLAKFVKELEEKTFRQGHPNVLNNT